MSALDRGPCPDGVISMEGLALWCREAAFEGLAIVGLFWALKCWLERNEAYSAGVESSDGYYNQELDGPRFALVWRAYEP